VSTTDSDSSQSENWNANLYLYDGAKHRNVIMMLHAIALGADKNFVNENDQGCTPLIQAILSVSEIVLFNEKTIYLI